MVIHLSNPDSLECDSKIVNADLDGIQFGDEKARNLGIEKL